MTGYLAPLIAALRGRAAVTRHRAVVVVAGEAEWCRRETEVLLSSDALWVTDHPPLGVRSCTGEKGETLLGGEWGELLYDAHCGFNADAFGAVAGTLRGGGLLLLLTPPLEQWAAYPDPDLRRFDDGLDGGTEIGGRFIRRFVRLLRSAPGVTLVEQGVTLPPPPEAVTGTPCHATGGVEGEALTADQAMAVQAIEQVVHSATPCVVTADRGRGKSAALGIAAARLLQRGQVERVVVTAPRLSAVAALFERLQSLLPDAHHGRGYCRLPSGAVLQFYPPDELLLNPPDADLLLVDEAAAIPAPLLERMVVGYPAAVFASTIHGYEGSGRGFTLRFQKALDRLALGWRSVTLTAPIRWGGGDPLEALTFRALLLDAEPATDAAVAGATPDGCHSEWLSQQQLLDDEMLLGELFGLLVLAHYRTAPNDLRQLLDAPYLDCWVTRYRGHVVATALVAREGAFDADLARQVWLGERRPRGHLFPQSLAFHAGFAEACELRSGRVMRIAVHPAVQGRGIGSQLLRAISSSLQQAGVDLLGSSFGATPELVRFWRRAGMLPLYLGLGRNKSSAEHALLMGCGLSDAGRALVVRAAERFQQNLPHLSRYAYRGLEESLARLLASDREPQTVIDMSQERADLEAFAHGHRSLTLTLPVVVRQWQWLAAEACRTAAGGQLLRLAEGADTATLIAEAGQTGRGAFIARLRTEVGRLLEGMPPGWGSPGR